MKNLNLSYVVRVLLFTLVGGFSLFRPPALAHNQRPPLEDANIREELFLYNFHVDWSTLKSYRPVLVLQFHADEDRVKVLECVYTTTKDFKKFKAILQVTPILRNPGIIIDRKRCSELGSTSSVVLLRALDRFAKQSDMSIVGTSLAGSVVSIYGSLTKKRLISNVSFLIAVVLAYYFANSVVNSIELDRLKELYLDIYLNKSYRNAYLAVSNDFIESFKENLLNSGMEPSSREYLR